MRRHPLNSAVRFLLELTALVIFGSWGWHARPDGLRYVLMFGLPLVAAFIWGTFRVPGDPGKAAIAIPGVLRLCIELLVFGAAFLALGDLGREMIKWIFGALVLLHYAASYDRIRWLLKKK